ncbi:MAG: type II secretion system F family protein, partial [Acidimicrobiia bacterium]
LLLALGVFLLYDGLTRTRVDKRRVSFADRSGSWLAAAGLADVSPSQFVLASIAAGLTAMVLAIVVVGSAGVALVAAFGGLVVPATYFRSRRRALRAARRREWPDAIELLAGAVRAGDTLPAAIGVVAERGPSSLRIVFRSMVTDHRVTGDLAGALERMGAAVADPIADRIVRTLVLAHRVGGSELGRVLRTLSAFLREDIANRREIEARQSWTVIAARVSAAAPWLVLVLVASRPQGAHAFDSPTGIVVLVVGAIVTTIGYRLMMRLGRLPEERRVLPVGEA